MAREPQGGEAGTGDSRAVNLRPFVSPELFRPEVRPSLEHVAVGEIERTLADVEFKHVVEERPEDEEREHPCILFVDEIFADGAAEPQQAPLMKPCVELGHSARQGTVSGPFVSQEDADRSVVSCKPQDALPNRQ